MIINQGKEKNYKLNIFCLLPKFPFLLFNNSQDLFSLEYEKFYEIFVVLKKEYFL